MKALVARGYRAVSSRIDASLKPYRRRQTRARVLASVKHGGHIATQEELTSVLGEQAMLADPEILVLKRYAEDAKGPIVEIGAAFGASGLLFLLHGTHHVTSIDPFVQDSNGAWSATEERCRMAVSKGLIDAGKEARLTAWTIRPDYSYNVAPSWFEPIGFLLIDGDHTYDAVAQDFRDWYGKVLPGGVIAFHDSCRPAGQPDNVGGYNKGWRGPTDFCQTLRADDRVSLIEQVSSLSLFRKR